MKNQTFFNVDIARISREMSEKVNAEMSTGKTQYQICEEVGISSRTYRELKKRQAGWQIRIDVFCLCMSWLKVEDPGVYFIKA